MLRVKFSTTHGHSHSLYLFTVLTLLACACALLHLYFVIHQNVILILINRFKLLLLNIIVLLSAEIPI